MAVGTEDFRLPTKGLPSPRAPQSCSWSYEPRQSPYSRETQPGCRTLGHARRWSPKNVFQGLSLHQELHLLVSHPLAALLVAAVQGEQHAPCGFCDQQRLSLI